jgi:hypothetical protein
VFNKKEAPGIRPRAPLLTSLVLIIAGTTASSLLIVRSRLQQHVQETIPADLQHSVEIFQDIEPIGGRVWSRRARCWPAFPA